MTERRTIPVGERTAAILGLAVGISFTICFLTGLLSHLIQHPPAWFSGARPAGLYRITQGVHVATGIVAIPLLFAKLWAVARGCSRRRSCATCPTPWSGLSVPLVGGALFLLVTGVANIDLWYPWPFFFPAGHYWVAWVTIGALIVHIGAKATITRTALGAIRRSSLHPRRAPARRRRFRAEHRPAPDPLRGRSRATLTLATVGQTSRRCAALAFSRPAAPTAATRASPSTRRRSKPTSWRLPGPPTSGFASKEP